MTDYCKLAAAVINTNVYECLGCEHLIRTDCPQYEPKTFEVTNQDFSNFFDDVHNSTVSVSEET